LGTLNDRDEVVDALCEAAAEVSESERLKKRVSTDRWGAVLWEVADGSDIGPCMGADTGPSPGAGTGIGTGTGTGTGTGITPVPVRIASDRELKEAPWSMDFSFTLSGLRRRNAGEFSSYGAISSVVSIAFMLLL
jgi:hypothetical protein